VARLENHHSDRGLSAQKPAQDPPCLFDETTRDELNALVDRLRVQLAEPVVIAEITIPIRASVGLVEVHRDDERAAEEILHDADRAMYKAKRAGRGNVCP
jgi:diguanylate cyclase (GGDEF)-like protein